MKDEQKKEKVLVVQIVSSKFNPRKTFEKEGLKELQESIKTHGILQAILVRSIGVTKGKDPQDVYEIICGERRYRAAVALGLAEVPVRIVEMDDTHVLEAQVVENLQRAELHPLEEAEGYESLMKNHGCEGAEEIAAKVGKDKKYVYRRLALCALIPECRKAYMTGKLTDGTAFVIARMPKDAQKKIMKEVEADDDGTPMSLSDVRQVIHREFMLDLKDAAFAKDDTVCPELGSCIACQKRTKGQDLLFPDIKDEDKCTDPVCFNKKREALIARQTEKAKKTGLEVVKTEKVFPYGDHVSGGFVSMDDKCWKDEKNRTYKQLLKNSKTFKPSLAVDQKGVIREVADQKEAEKAIKDTGIKFQAGMGRDVENEKKVKDERKVRDAVYLKALPILCLKVGEDKKQGFWTLLAELVLKEANWDRRRTFARVIDPNCKPGMADEVIAGYLKKLTAADLPAFVMGLLATSSFSGSNDYSDGFVALAELYKVNLIAVEKEVKNDVLIKKTSGASK